MELKRTAVKWMPWLIDIKIIIELPLYLESLEIKNCVEFVLQTLPQWSTAGMEGPKWREEIIFGPKQV